MGPTTATTRRTLPWLAALLGVLLAAAMVFAGAPGAHAAPGDDQEKTDFYFAGVITFEDKPVEGVTVTVEGGGFKAETETDADGKWRLYVPEKGKYTLTVDESTLPDGRDRRGRIRVRRTSNSGSRTPRSSTSSSAKACRVTVSFLDQLIERLMNGINFGLLLALAAIGVSLIFGTTGLSNFAHGEMLTFGAIMALVFGSWLAWPMWIVLPLVIVLGGVLGVTLDAGLWRPLRRRGLGLVQLMIVSIGLSLALRYVYQFFIGGGTYQLPGAGAGRDIHFGPISLSWIDVVSMAIEHHPSRRRRLLAAAHPDRQGDPCHQRQPGTRRRIRNRRRPRSSGSSGSSPPRSLRIAGVLWAYFRPGVKWDMGGQVLLLIFAAVTLGGLGTAFGALIGSLIVGILVEVSTLWIPPDMKYVGALVVLIVILLVRPQGILGRKERLG